jgi:hypothetical protein
MAIRARAPRPRSATAATRGKEMPPVSASFGGALAEALAVGLAEALADGLSEALADGLAEVLMEALEEDLAPPPSPPETLTLAVI